MKIVIKVNLIIVSEILKMKILKMMKKIRLPSFQFYDLFTFIFNVIINL